jgi:Bacterial DNA polymerase III alpha subunit finger domain
VGEYKANMKEWSLRFSGEESMAKRISDQDLDTRLQVLFPVDDGLPRSKGSILLRAFAAARPGGCADLGIIKVDLLGLGMMAVLKDCLELIPEYYGERVDLAQLPEDKEVYATLQRADTIGMFQVEKQSANGLVAAEPTRAVL